MRRVITSPVVISLVVHLIVVCLVSGKVCFVTIMYKALTVLARLNAADKNNRTN